MQLAILRKQSADNVINKTLVMNFYKNGLLSSFFIFLSASCAFSQILIPFRDKTLWGYADTNGIVRIKPAYDKVNFFNYSKSTTEVYRDKKISLIDMRGKLMFPFSDSYAQMGNNYIVTQNKRKGVYSSSGVQLVPAEYDYFECTCYYDAYKAERDKIIAAKNDSFYLVSLNTSDVKHIPDPRRVKAIEGGSGVMEPIIDAELTSVPYPQLDSKGFPALVKYKNMVHCETIIKDTKRIFYIFCLWKEGKKIGYVGQNGIEFFKD
jgi:hypothetical protein